MLVGVMQTACYALLGLHNTQPTPPGSRGTPGPADPGTYGYRRAAGAVCSLRSHRQGECLRPCAALRLLPVGTYGPTLLHSGALHHCYADVRVLTPASGNPVSTPAAVTYATEESDSSSARPS